MYTDVSIDLETLGTKPGSVITQIGLVAFNQRPDNGGDLSTSGQQINVNADSCLAAGLTIDWSTVAWWLRQDELAREHMAQQGSTGHDIRHALIAVGDFLVENCGSARSPRVWGNGAGFDVTLLEVAYDKCHLPIPWDFRKIRDLRTLADLEPAHMVVRPAPDIQHRALDDAMAQAEWIKLLTSAVESRETTVFAD